MLVRLADTKVKLVKSVHITLQPEEELLDIVGELKAVDLSNDKEDPKEEAIG